MSFNPSRILLHGIALAIMTSGYLNLHYIPLDLLIKDQFGGHWQFLTIDGLALAWLTMVVGMLHDLFPGIQALYSLKRVLFMFSAPVSVVISTIYWTLMLLLPQLIYLNAEPSSSSHLPPEWRIPLPLDLALHAVPGTMLILDFFLFERKYTREALKWVPTIMLVVSGAYVSWVETCGAKNGVFPYPFLNHPFPIRMAIYTGATAIGGGAFLIMNALHV